MMMLSLKLGTEQTGAHAIGRQLLWQTLPFPSQSLADEVLLRAEFWRHYFPSPLGINIECGPGLQAALLGVESDLGSST